MNENLSITAGARAQPESKMENDEIPEPFGISTEASTAVMLAMAQFPRDDYGNFIPEVTVIPSPSVSND